MSLPSFPLRTEQDRARAIQILGECFEIREDSLFWKARPSAHFKNSRIANSWNAKHAGKKSGSMDGHGYLQVKVFGVLMLSHRLIFLMREGYLPGEIDHSDGEPQNNAPCNMAGVTHKKNMQNQKLRADNKSGLMGVFWYSEKQKWLVKIGGSHVGYFGSLFDACCSRKSAELTNCYHANHGRTANNG